MEIIFAVVAGVRDRVLCLGARQSGLYRDHAQKAACQGMEADFR